MPKDYFNINNTTSFSSLPENSKIHFIGVAGVFMGQMAITLSKAGYQVSGSDKAFFEPMGSVLKKSSVKLYESYNADNIEDDVELVVIGNSVSYGHVEVDLVEKKQIPYIALPELLYQFLIVGKKSIVVSGTHGKTTTSAILAQSLKELDQEPSYFFGGVVPSFGESLQNASGQVAVIEGDEYDSAFFAKVPKFSFYQPDIWIINALEFDHADIYSSLEQIISEFEKQLAQMGADSLVIVCTDFKEISTRLKAWRSKYQTKFLSFGYAENSDFQIVNRQQAELQEVFIKYDQQEIQFDLSLAGQLNARNALAAYIALKQLNISDQQISAAFSRLKGVQRRLEKFHEVSSNVFIEDFAHHPTAVKETLEIIKELYPDKRVVTLFQAATRTSRTNVLQDEFKDAFKATDLLYVMKAQVVDDLEPLDVSALGGIACNTADEMIAQIKKDFSEDTVYVLMSNSSFGGLKEKVSLQF